MTQFATDRRTLVKGAAWAVPAVTIAGAAPALAASTVPHDLSTSVPAGGTRYAGTNQMDLKATTFNNTGSETVEGLIVVFHVDSGQTIEDIITFGAPIEEVAVGATISGEGTNEVTLTLAPGTQQGQVTIPAGGSYTAPAGQTLMLGSETGFTLTVTVNAGNMTSGDIPFMTSTLVNAA